MVIAAQKILKSNRVSEHSGWVADTYGRELKIKVAPVNISRSLRIFDAIIKLLRSRGHDVDSSGRETYAVIEGERIAMALREKLRVEKFIRPSGWTSYKYFPIGKLIFKVDNFHSKEFIDDKVPLEDKLPLILAELEYRGQKEKERRIENEIYWAKEAERKRIEYERKEIKDKELQKFKYLIKELKLWHKSVILDNYLKEVEQRAIENNSLTNELKTWLEWAKQKADWFNPFIKKEDDTLNDQDRLIL